MVKIPFDFHKALWLFAIYIVSLSLYAADIKVSADRNPVSLNESFHLVYETSDSVDESPDFSPLEPFVEIVNQSQNSKVSIVNGTYTSSRSWRLTVMMKQTGNVTLPPVNFGSDKSPELKLTVKAESKNLIAKSSFFARLEADVEQLYVQQQLVVTLQLFSDKNLSAYGMGELQTRGMDALIEPLGEEKQYQTRLSNRDYLVLERKFAVFPQGSGSLQFLPVRVEARTGSAVNSIFGSMSNRGMLMRTMSNGLDVAVQPVPAAADMNPWLPASELELVEQWPENPPRFVEGEPVTRTLSLKAEGLTSVQLPELPEVDIPGLKQYPDQPMLNDVRNESGISGYRLQKVAFVPTRAGRIELPAIEIPWWDIDTESRQLARIPARVIQVAAIQKPQAPVAPPPQPDQAPPAAEVTPPPQTDDAALESASSHWQIIALVLGAGWLLTLVVWMIRARKGPDESSVEPGSDSQTAIKQSYQRLTKACKDEDASACRRELLAWAQAVFSDHTVTTLSDVFSRLPPELAAQIQKLDAVLYGGQQQHINFSLIQQQARDFRPSMERPRGTGSGVLEPLYK
jgi:hypothetical protein